MKKVTALLLMMLLLLTGCKGKTVMKSEDFKLSNAEFAYYYWTEINSGKDALQESVDLSKPLDEQMYDETRTWQDYLTDHVLEQVKETMALVFAAQDDGFELPKDYEESLDDVIVNFTDAAMGGGYKNLSAYLKEIYGKGAKEDSFRQYLYYTHMAAAYADTLYARSEPTEEEALAYMEKNPGAYADSGIEQALQNLHSEDYNNAIMTAINGCTFTTHRENIRITAPKGLDEN